MGFRWFGSADDPIPLAYVRQIPGVTQIVGALFDVPVGETWTSERIGGLRAEVEAAGLSLEVIESVNIHDDIKIGLPERDRYIENYIATIENLAGHGIKVICYNFMPVFDWVRTDLRYQLADGSHVLALDSDLLQRAGCAHYWVIDPDEPSIVAWRLTDGVYVEVARASGAEPFEVAEPFPVRFTPASLAD